MSSELDLDDVAATSAAAKRELRALRSSEHEGWRYADELDQERRRLTAELAALRKDAMRYRWLREAKSWPAAFASCSAPEPLAKTELDAAIDAMQEAP